MRQSGRLLALPVFLGVLLVGCQSVPSVVHIEPPERVLFIGNSLTYFNWGIDHHFMELAASSSPPLEVQTKSVVSAGFMLWSHYRQIESNYPSTRILAEGDWDVVVLQEIMRAPLDPELQPLFRQYAHLLHDHIATLGAETVLFMTWGRDDTPGMTEQLVPAYLEMGKELNVLVVPVGMAWLRAAKDQPDIRLYNEDPLDHVHPSLCGTYLSACVFYASLMGLSPVGLPYTAGLDEEVAQSLQQVAWDAVTGFYRW